MQQWALAETKYFNRRWNGMQGHTIYAEVNTPQGSYVVAESPTFHDHSSFQCPSWCERWPTMGDLEAKEALDRVVAELVGDGWEVVKPGGASPENWFAYQFRRPTPSFRDAPPGALLTYP